MNALQPPTISHRAVAPNQMRSTYDPWRIAGSLAAVAALLSGFLPWVSVRAIFIGDLNVTGFETPDGKLAAVAASVTLLGFLVQSRWLGFVGSAAIGGIAIYEIAQMSRAVTEANAAFDGMGVATTGYGLWVLAAASVLAVVANGCYTKTPR